MGNDMEGICPEDESETKSRRLELTVDWGPHENLPATNLNEQGFTTAHLVLKREPNAYWIISAFLWQE